MTGHQEGLEVRGLGARLGGSYVLQGVDLRARTGEITALVGPNGSGKSTLLRAIAGLVDSSGDIEFEGVSLGALDPRERATRVAYVPQVSALDAPLRVHDVVLQGRFAHRGIFAATTDADIAAAEEAMERAGVEMLADRPVTELSGGERQRVFVGRALATGAKLLLLDEPTSAQDIAQVLALRAVMAELAESGKTVLVALHDLSEVRELAHHVALMDAGRVVASGPATEVVANEHVVPSFGATIVEGGGLGYRPAQTAGEVQA